MLNGTIALIIRYILLIGGGALASAGLITATGNEHFCFDAKMLADTAAAAITMMLGGGASVVAGIGWRALVKRQGGVT